VNVCFCCVRFSFSIRSQEVGLENVSEMTYFVLSKTSSSSLLAPAFDTAWLQLLLMCLDLQSIRSQ